MHLPCIHNRASSIKGHTYIGYTLDPRRRIRQHNGEIGSGASQTKKKRPWEMVFCIYGFPTNTAALQFEWAWQNPIESVKVQTAAASFKSLSGLGNKIKLAYTMLTLPTWNSLNLTVNLFSTKYQHYTSACPPLPDQMCTRVCSMEDLPCYNVDDKWDDDNETANFYNGSVSEENLPDQISHKDSDESSGCVVQGLSKKSPSISEEEDEDRGLLSPTRKSFSFASSSSYVVEDIQSPMVVEKRRSTSMVSDKDLVWIKNSDIVRGGVEVIDLFTPSPCSVASLGGNKRRPRIGQEIIDLTNSPLFV